jgi:hypothetical protein
MKFRRDDGTILEIEVQADFEPGSPGYADEAPEPAGYCVCDVFDDDGESIIAELTDREIDRIADALMDADRDAYDEACYCRWQDRQDYGE